MADLPLGLRNALEAGECVLFIGAGMGRYYKNSAGEPLPDGVGLAKALANKFSIAAPDKPDLMKISKIVELRKGRPELNAFLKSQLIPTYPDKNVQWICSIKWRAIFTTNYDRGIQTAYEQTANVKQKPITFSTTSDIEPYDPRFDLPIYHLHGALFDQNPNIIITDDDYSVFKEKRRMLFELLKKEFITSTILYIGYSNEDPNWKLLLHEIESEFYPSKMPSSYRIAPDTDPLDVEILASKNIINLDHKYHDFISVASSTLELVEDDEFYSRIHSTIPTELHSIFDKNPAPLARLLASWEYVNQAPFNELPNTNLFLNGDCPNWALIGQELYFERDIEEDLYDDLLDYITSTKKRLKVNILLSPAGYGTTTLLMIVAAKLVKDRACKVFKLKPGREVIEGDVLFAESIFKEKVCFIVDNAADHKRELHSILQRFKESNKTSLFLFGERLNEWRQSLNIINGNEFAINPLSDSEINRLLDYLGAQGALNKLEPLNRNLQFTAIKKNYNQELLVAMREATEGVEFDAILEDEFRGINGDIAKTAYLTVCCFYLNKVYVRDALLAELLSLSVVDLHDQTKEPTEGVIIYDLIDETRGEYGARARQRKIAEVVWERCGASLNKDSILRNIIDHLNLNYSIDARAFELFYRSDSIVDSLSSIDEKLKFFEKACKKDPESPYVRQHYARMLYRENKAELALSQVETAINIDDKVRVLYHTKGLILSKMAMDDDSLSLARRRLIQSENSYRKALNLAVKDPYCYQGLARLYINWAEKIDDQDEITDYISKAENIITDGLRNCRYRDKLWIESAKVQEFLGNHPGYIKHLERAVFESPDSIVARYILGRTYRRQGDYRKAIEILEPVINNHPDEFRSYVEYALSMHLDGSSYKECIAVLRLSTLYGYRDPRYISILGGLYFLNGDFTGAETVFKESTKRNFTVMELNRVQFRPLNLRGTSPFTVEGEVIKVRAGYALIDSAMMPKPIVCPGSKYRGIVMKKNLRVSFRLSFSAKGPVAENIETL